MPNTPGLPSYNGSFCVMGGIPVEPFPDGSIASFNTDAGPTDYNTHYLGFVKPGATDFWVKTAKGGVGTPLTHDGHMPLLLPQPQLIPDIGGRVCGDLVAIFANGEDFDSSEANQILVYHSSGLFVTDFGTPGNLSFSQSAPSGKSGNFVSNAFVRCSDGNVRILHSDESCHAGIHEWTLENVNSINVVSAVDVHNAANFGLRSAVAHTGSAATPATAAPQLNDTFNRGDSPVVGNGWQDPNSSFGIVGGRLKVTNGGLAASWLATTLLRPEVTGDTDQTIQVPAQFFDPTKMWTFPGVVTNGY